MSITITVRTYNASLVEGSQLTGFISCTGTMKRNAPAAGRIVVANTAANRSALSGAYLVKVEYERDGTPLDAAAVWHGDKRLEFNQDRDQIILTGVGLAAILRDHRLHDKIISDGRWDPRQGDTPYPNATIGSYIEFPAPSPPDPDGGTPLERWVAETDAVGGGKTQCQLTGANDIGGTYRALIDSNYFNGEAWSNGSPITGTGDRPLSLYSNDRTDTEWDQLIYHSGLSWVFNSHPNLSTPLSGTTLGTYTNARGDSVWGRALNIAQQAGGIIFDRGWEQRLYYRETPYTASGVVLSNDGTSTQSSGKADVESAERIVPEISRITRIRGFGSSGVVLADGRTKIEALPEYIAETETVVDWTQSIISVPDWETGLYKREGPVQVYTDLVPVDTSSVSAEDVAVALYLRMLSDIKSQDPDYEYATVTAYFPFDNPYPGDQVTISATAGTSPAQLNGTWVIDEVTHSISGAGGERVTRLKLISDLQAASLLSPIEQDAVFTRAVWEHLTSISNSGLSGGSFSSGGGGTGGTGLTIHALDGPYHTGTLPWEDLDLTASNLADLATRPHAALQTIQPDDHHSPVTVSTPLTLLGQLVGLDSSALAGAGLDTEGVALDVNTGDGITISADAVTFDPGDGMQILSNKGAVKASDFAGNGLTASSNDLHVGTPTSLSVSSTNSVTTSSHTHAVTASSAPGASSALLKSDASGYLQLRRLGLNVAPSYPLHVRDTVQQLRLDYDAGNYAGITVGSDGTTTLDTTTGGAGGNLKIAPAGDVIFDPVGDDILPQTGYDLNIGSLQKKYLTLHAAELWVETLVAQNTIATIGGRVLVGPTTVLEADLSSLSGTITVKHNEMASGDIVYMEADAKVEFMAITSAASGTGPYTYSVTRNLDGTGANDWYAGDAVFNTGQVGDGFIDLYSVNAINGSGVKYGPTIAGNVRNSSTFNDWSEHWAVGNLEGLYGYGTTAYGAAFGRYAADSPWVSVDSVNGFRIMRGTTPEQLAKWATDGSMLIGKTGSGNGNLYIDATGDATWRLDTDERIKVSTAGWVRVGEVGAGLGNLLINPAGDSHWRINTTRKVSIEADGDVLIGTDTTDPSTTHLAIFSTAQTYNGESVAVGDILWGDNSAGEFNELWDLSAGQRYIREGTTNRVSFSQRGMHWYGSLFGGWDDNSLITFQRLDSPTSSVGGMHAYANASVRQFYLEIESDPAYSAWTSGVQLFAHGLGDSSSRAYLYSDVVNIDAADYIETDAPHVYIAKDITFGATYNSSHGSKRYVDTGFGDTVEVSFTVPCVPPLTNVAYDGNDTVTAGSAVTVDAQDWGVPNGATGIHVYVKNSWASASASNYFQIRAIGGQPCVETTGIAAGGSAAASGFVGLDASGQFKLYASNSNATNVKITISGYTI